MRVDLDRIHRFIVSVFSTLGVPHEHAAITASRLLEADLRGRHGHGLIRVPQYVTRIEKGGINPTPEITIRCSTPVSAVVDGDNGLGQVVMTRATTEAIQRGTENGMAWVGTTRSNHAGAAGVYTGMALESDLIAIYIAVASANVMPPWGGSERILGTNPISIAIPAGDEPAFQLDIATTATSHGTIKTYAQRGEPLPVGWVQDAEGGAITDPGRADEGFLVPIGGYKGSGLTMAIGLLAGVLNEAAFGTEVLDHRSVADVAANTGQAIFVMRPDLFRDMGDFKEAMDRHTRDLRAAGSPGAVHIPGQSLDGLEQEQRRDGVSVSDELLGQLRALGDRLDVEDDLRG